MWASSYLNPFPKHMTRSLSKHKIKSYSTTSKSLGWKRLTSLRFSSTTFSFEFNSSMSLAKFSLAISFVNFSSSTSSAGLDSTSLAALDSSVTLAVLNPSTSLATWHNRDNNCHQSKKRIPYKMVIVLNITFFLLFEVYRIFPIKLITNKWQRQEVRQSQKKSEPRNGIPTTCTSLYISQDFW